MELVRVEKKNIKFRIAREFAVAYEEGCALDKKIILSTTREYYVAMINGEEVGHIVLNDKSRFFVTRLMNVTQAFVHPQHRHKGVLRKMLEQVIADHNVRMIHIEAHRYLRNFDYYRSLGFEPPRFTGNSLQFLLHKDAPAQQAAA